MQHHHHGVIRRWTTSGPRPDQTRPRPCVRHSFPISHVRRLKWDDDSPASVNDDGPLGGAIIRFTEPNDIESRLANRDESGIPASRQYGTLRLRLRLSVEYGCAELLRHGRLRGFFVTVLISAVCSLSKQLENEDGATIFKYLYTWTTGYTISEIPQSDSNFSIWVSSSVYRNCRITEHFSPGYADPKIPAEVSTGLMPTR